MKLALTLILAVLSTSAFAAPGAASAPSVNCSQAAKGKVTIVVHNQQIDQSTGARLAFSCFARLPQNVKAIGAILKKASDDANATPSQCLLGKVAVLEVSSWNAGRPYGSYDDKTQKTTYTTGGESVQLVTQGYSCGAIGTGLYDGIVETIAMRLHVENSLNLGDIEDDSAQVTQSLEITAPKLVNITQ